MKIGDYVSMITNKWQQHNEWMEFPEEPPVLLGIVVDLIQIPGNSLFMAKVLESDGLIFIYPSFVDGKVSQYTDAALRKLK